MKPNLGHRRLIGTAGHTHPARQFPKFIDSVKTSPDLLGLFRFQVHESGKEDEFGIARTQAGENFYTRVANSKRASSFLGVFLICRMSEEDLCKRKKEILHMV